MRKNNLAEWFGCDADQLRNDLIAYFNENPMDIIKLAELIGINRQTLGRLLDGRAMRAGTMVKIKRFLDLAKEKQ